MGSAYNSRAARREAQKRANANFSINLRWLIALTHNAVAFENLPDDLPKRYLMRNLIDYGSIAYDKQTKLFLRYVASGIDIYGLPQNYTLYGYNGYSITRKPEEVVILRINDISEPIKPFLYEQAQRISDYDTAIKQNLEAIRTMTIAEVDSDSALLSLVNEAEARRIGSTIVYKNTKSMQGSKLSCTNTGAQYLIDKLQEARQRVINETLARLGVASANTEKRERVQSTEVNASLGYAVDSVAVEVDTFNYDAEQGGLDIRMRTNTSAIKMWEAGLPAEGNNNVDEDKNDMDENKKDMGESV